MNYELRMLNKGQWKEVWFIKKD